MSKFKEEINNVINETINDLMGNLKHEFFTPADEHREAETGDINDFEATLREYIEQWLDLNHPHFQGQPKWELSSENWDGGERIISKPLHLFTTKEKAEKWLSTRGYYDKRPNNATGYYGSEGAYHHEDAKLTNGAGGIYYTLKEVRREIDPE